jgi:RecA-family ATPase
VKINTLFGMAQRAGWANPRKGLRKGVAGVAGPSARDEFAPYIGGQSIDNTGHGHDQSIDPDTGEITEPPKGWPEIDYSLLKLPPIDYLIEGFFAHSFSVFAGQPGVGKTTAVVSLALIVAGFNIPGSDCTTKSRRKIIYVSEDSAQIVRSLYGYCKIFGFDPLQIAQWFVLIDSRRSDVDEVLRLAHNVDIHTIKGGKGNERPWLIIDTANATLDIENENDNSEVGKYIAALKELIYTKMHTPLSIITHTSKTVGRADDGALARGASAFTGDATLTGAIFLDEDERYFRLTKHRYEPEFKEVRFETQFHEAVVLDRHGDMQAQRCIVVTPVSSSQGAREAIRDEAREAEQEGRQREVLDRVTQYVRALINKTPQGVCMRKGRLPKNPPAAMADMHRLGLEEIKNAVEGSSSNDVRSRIVWKIIHEFAADHENSDNLWVQLK